MGWSDKKSPAGSQYSSIEYHKEKMAEISGQVSQRNLPKGASPYSVLRKSDDQTMDEAAQKQRNGMVRMTRTEYLRELALKKRMEEKPEIYSKEQGSLDSYRYRDK